MPTSEEELKWFDEGCGIQNSGDFFERIYKRLNLGTENCKYCGGSGYDPYQNHDTTMRPCPKCNFNSEYNKQKNDMITEEFLEWLTVHFDFVDGDWYWKSDEYGDNPLSHNEIIDLYESTTTY